MNREELENVFEEYNDLQDEFEWNESLPSKRPDLCAFILLDKFYPDDRNIAFRVSGDLIILGVSLDDLIRKPITKQDIEILVRCGVRVGEYCELYMYR